MSKRKRTQHEKQMGFYAMLFGMAGLLVFIAILWLVNAG
jgi:hypothetical protein